MPARSSLLADAPLVRQGGLDSSSLRVVYRHRLHADSSERADELATMPPDGLVPVVNAMLDRLGAHAIHSLEDAQWDEVDARAFTRVALNLLRFGQAYDDERMTSAEATTTLETFMDSFRAPRLFSSTDKHRLLTDEGERATKTGGYGSGLGLRGATFDNGVIVIDASHIGMLWFFDED